jgi:hypothetical protein
MTGGGRNDGGSSSSGLTRGSTSQTNAEMLSFEHTLKAVSAAEVLCRRVRFAKMTILVTFEKVTKKEEL